MFLISQSHGDSLDLLSNVLCEVHQTRTKQNDCAGGLMLKILGGQIGHRIANGWPPPRMAVRYGTFRLCVLRTSHLQPYRTSVQSLKRIVPTYRTLVQYVVSLTVPSINLVKQRFIDDICDQTRPQNFFQGGGKRRIYYLLDKIKPY